MVKCDQSVVGEIESQGMGLYLRPSLRTLGLCTCGLYNTVNSHLLPTNTQLPITHLQHRYETQGTLHHFIHLFDEQVKMHISNIIIGAVLFATTAMAVPGTVSTSNTIILLYIANKPRVLSSARSRTSPSTGLLPTLSRSRASSARAM